MKTQLYCLHMLRNTLLILTSFLFISESFGSVIQVDFGATGQNVEVG